MWSASVLYRMSGLSLSGLCSLSGLSGLSGLNIALCISLVCVSAFSHEDTFRYQVLSSRRNEACSMCFGDDCWELQKDRCRYYAEVNDALSGGEPVGEGEVGEVDDLVYDMVGQAASSWMAQECVPFVSHHTDCNKENICVGCKSCSCDAVGRWSCKPVQQCRPEPYLDVDHKILVSVQDTLKDDKLARKKRNAKDENKKPGEPHNISYVDIAQWMYGVKPDVVSDVTETRTIKVTAKRTPTTTELTKINESDYIEFDEVLKNIAIDNQKYKRRKPQLNETNFEIKDYIDLDESTVNQNNETDTFVNMLNAIIEANDNTSFEQTVEESTKVVIDLLVPPKHDENSNDTNHIDWSSNFIRDDNNDSNDTIVYDAINIMKRDVASVSNVTNITTEATTEKINITKPIDDLKNGVLSPLTKIIVDKEQELKDLIKIKDNLIQFINNNSSGIEIDLKSQEVINNTNTILSIYNLDIFPDIQTNLRKINPDSLNKLLYKLKRDIYEVIRDVVGIKKLSGGNNLPIDLKILVRAMSSYVHKQGNVTNFIKNGIKLKDGGIRRHQDNEDNEDNFNSTKDYLIRILEVLDKDMPNKAALSPLSQGTRKVVGRVIKNLYSDDFSVIALRVYDPEYNLTTELKQIGSNWERMTANVAASAPANKIYALKLLHLVISVDINKLNDALALVDFAHSRRMIPIEGIRGEMVLERIDHGLRSIEEKIKTIIKYKSGHKVEPQMKTITKPGKKKSFLNKIRNLLKGSKSDIVELVKKKVPKADIVKQIAKKRLDELARKKISEYQDTMKKWQNTLNVIPRYKRSSDLNKINNSRMKNIIPKYLRGKLDPAIVAKMSKIRQNEATLKKRANTKHKKAVKVTSTTVKTRYKATKDKNARNGKSTKNRPNDSVKRRPKKKIPNAKSLNKRLIWRENRRE